jgi:hypothetical protein
MSDKNIEVSSLDLSEMNNQQLLLDAIEAWEEKGLLNKTNKHEKACAIEAIKNAEAIGFENACLYVQGQLHSFLLYELPVDARYAILTYARFSYEIPFIFEYSIYEFAKWFQKNKIKYVNIVEDNGQAFVRSIKLGMNPINFFKKYTIKPRK